MDCFFVAVIEAAHPALRGLPVAVCHSASARGTGEVSSANYAARAFGVRAGQWVRSALEACPDLILVPYDFEGYQRASEALYRHLWALSAAVQPLSCDEACADVTGLGNAAELGERLRADIRSATGCAASVGVGPNPLVAKIAASRAKPDGLVVVKAEEVTALMDALPLAKVPGVGRAALDKLGALGISSARALRAHPVHQLEHVFGPLAARNLRQAASGQDDRIVADPPPRRSVGAE
ncbi:impB/mucB/samB UV-protection protein, partial [Helicosporidium sp. ATCC 50920]